MTKSWQWISIGICKCFDGDLAASCNTKRIFFTSFATITTEKRGDDFNKVVISIHLVVVKWGWDDSFCIQFDLKMNEWSCSPTFSGCTWLMDLISNMTGKSCNNSYLVECNSLLSTIGLLWHMFLDGYRVSLVLSNKLYIVHDTQKL